MKTLFSKAKKTLTNKGKKMNEKNQNLMVKTKTWIANKDGEILFGKGKTELLEFIDKTGSILKASGAMGINYKKAWTHLDTLQTNAGEALVIKKQGRSQTSGTKLTERARELMANFEILQKDVEAYANKRFKELFR